MLRQDLEQEVLSSGLGSRLRRVPWWLWPVDPSEAARALQLLDFTSHRLINSECLPPSESLCCDTQLG